MIKKVEHVALIAKNIDDSISFYTEVFEFKVRAQGTNATRHMAFLYHDKIPAFEIELIQDLHEGQVYSEQGIVNHLAFTVDDIVAAIEYYSQRGVQFPSTQVSPAIDGGKTAFFYGPNGELLQLVEPPQDRKL